MRAMVAVSWLFLAACDGGEVTFCEDRITDRQHCPEFTPEELDQALHECNVLVGDVCDSDDLRILSDFFDCATDSGADWCSEVPLPNATLDARCSQRAYDSLSGLSGSCAAAGFTEFQ